MARGFGSTLGAGSTDSIAIPLTAHATQRSYSIFVYRNGSGAGNFGRIFDKRVSGAQTETLYVGDTNYAYLRAWSGAQAVEWRMTAPSAGAFRHVGVSYDGSSTANDAIMYLDGVSQTVSEAAGPPSGALVTNEDSYVLGNRKNDSARVWNGILAEFGVWDAILTAEEMASLAQGCSPLLIRPASLVAYQPLTGTPCDFVAGGPTTVVGTAEQDHPRIIYPAWPEIILPAAAAASGASGSASITESADSVAGSANIVVIGSAAITEAADTVTATGVSSSASVGTAAITEAADSAVGAGNIVVIGTAAITESADSVFASDGSIADAIMKIRMRARRTPMQTNN
jgi:hypothetical protein